MALAGFMGCGKSTVGKAVAARLGRRFIDLDEVVVGEAGRPISELFELAGEAGFRRQEAASLPLALQPDTIVALGGGTPLGEANWQLLQARARTIWLEAPLEVIWERVAGDAARPLLKSRSREELAQLLAQREPRYRECVVHVDASQPLEVVIEETLRACGG